MWQAVVSTAAYARQEGSWNRGRAPDENPDVGWGNYLSYMYLDMLEREWKRPVTDADRVRSFGNSSSSSPRASIVIQFWSYFEARIERLLTDSMRKLPPRVREGLLYRHSGITHQIDKLYRILFETSYWADLSRAGLSMSWPRRPESNSHVRSQLAQLLLKHR